jgi:hypothetical protein
MGNPPGTGPAVQGPVVVGKAYGLVLWLVQKVERFPKSYRFSVGIPGTPYLIPSVSGVGKSTAAEHGERGGGP